MNRQTSKKDIQQLQIPKKHSHKWDNGSVLVIGGSRRYHGAPLLALQTAARFVDIVHFSSPENYAYLLPKLRKGLMEFIPVFSKDLWTYIDHVDVVLIGPGFEVTHKNRRLVNDIIKKRPHKKIVFDAGAIRQVELKRLTKFHIITPNVREYIDVLHHKPTPEQVQKDANQLQTTILAKGPQSFIASGKACARNSTGNAGLTKGGTGDILAGLIAAFFAKNNAFLSAKAASYLLGATADALFKNRHFAYSASDILAELPLQFGKLRNTA